MSTRYIRIYEGVSEDTDIIGASRSIPEVVYGVEERYGRHRNAIRSFLKVMGHDTMILVPRTSPNINEESRGFDTKILDIPDTSRSHSHMEVKPPMSDETVDMLAAFIIAHNVADGGNDGVMMFDQRPGKDRLVQSWS
jgi:hypothetical protein